MIQLYECPTCGKDSAAFAEDGTTGTIHCPACAPTPDKEPHDYRPLMLGGVVTIPAGTRILPDEDGCAYFLPNLISGVCCGDSGDCGHECGIA